MNDRIKELKKQCQVEKHWDADTQKWVDGHFDIDKFARLIVNESALAITKEVDGWSQLAPFNHVIKQRGIQALKQHFGL